jgi:hypothetical protein
VRRRAQYVAARPLVAGLTTTTFEVDLWDLGHDHVYTVVRYEALAAVNEWCDLLDLALRSVS